MILSKPVAAVVAVLLAVAAAAVQKLALSNDVADVLALSIIVLGAFGVAPAAGAWFATHVSPHLLAALTVVLMIAQALQQDSLHVGSTVHAVIAVVIVGLVAMGVSPAGAGGHLAWVGDPEDQRHG